MSVLNRLGMLWHGNKYNFKYNFKLFFIFQKYATSYEYPHVFD